MFSDLAAPRTLLGGAVFGETAPKGLTLGACLIHVPLRVLRGDPLDLWTGESAVADASRGIVKAAATDMLCFGIVPVGDGPLEDRAHAAYLALFDYLSHSPCPHLLRIWNYLPRITEVDDSGIERYRRFNSGRHEAFVEAFSNIGIPPAASALGTHLGQPCLYFLSGARPGVAIENPRQVSAYRYPAQYGPRSPSFSRSLLAPWDDGHVFLISGTASIVGHETRHAEDVTAQTVETIVNLRTLLDEAGNRGFRCRPRSGRLKIYIRHPDDLPAIHAIVEDAFPGARTLYLHADICRPDLLVEIEAAFEETP